MSCLSKQHRLNNSREFNLLYKSGKKWHTPSFVAFFKPTQQFQIGFVTSKKVGKAVIRNKARRRLRALFLELEPRLKTGKYIFVAKETINNRSYDELKKDFNFAFKRLELYK